MYIFTKFLTFSDAAKMADVARNIVLGRGWGTLFNFFNVQLATNNPSLFPATNIPPAMVYSYALFFKIFGISDWSVIFTSTLFFMAVAAIVYLLGKKLYGKSTGILSAISVALNINFLEYAKSGASETLFVFEIVLVPYLMLMKKKWSDIAAGLVLLIMYFTRPQAFIFIAGYILFWLLLRYEWKTVFKYFLFLVLFGLFFDYLVLQRINDTTLSYSLIRRGVPAIVQHSQYVAVSDVLRGVGPQPSALTVILKKTATNLFNFYRLLPQIMSPYLFALFALGLFIKVKSEDVKYFKIVTVFTGVMIFLLAALTIPFFRYIHPVVPLIYIIAVGSLVNILSGLKTISIPGLEDKKTGKLIAFLIIVIFTVGINLGTLIHDYKYYEARNNFDKPPVYVLLSEKLKENTDSENFAITNLDTWGSWYGERKTMWFPLKPNQLIPPEGEQIPFDAIYLTSYLMDDENYYMGEEWRQIFYNPENPENEFIADNFEFKGAYQVSAEETYEKQDARAVLLVRKRN